jgi:hypothetical protein
MASEGAYKGVNAYVDEYVVSSEFITRTPAPAFSKPRPACFDGHLREAFAWYDK